MMVYLYMVIGAAVGAGVGLAVAALKKERRADDNPFGRASLIGAIVGGVLAAIVFNVTALGYEHGEHVIQIKSEEQFKQIVLNSDKPVLVDFYSTSCPPCRDMAPIMEEIAEEAEGRHLVASVDVRKNRKWVAAYYTGGVPHFFVYKNGRQVDETRGRQPKEEILKLLEPYID